MRYANESQVSEVHKFTLDTELKGGGGIVQEVE